MGRPILATLSNGRRTALTVGLAGLLLVLFAGVAYAATYEGTSGDNRFIGTPQTDRAVMKAGDDLARGLDRSDFLFGNAGDDELYGNDGTDFLDGGRDNDLLVGGEGEDELVGSYGDDTIYTGTTTDGDKVPDEVQCGEGYDIVYLSGNDHASHNNQRDKCEEINQY